jgi:hypothetical protein
MLKLALNLNVVAWMLFKSYYSKLLGGYYCSKLFWTLTIGNSWLWDFPFWSIRSHSKKKVSESHFWLLTYFVILISGSNVNAYINMVCDTLKNSIPKAVVYCQVREAKRSLLNRFYVQVGRKEVQVYIFLFRYFQMYSTSTTWKLFLSWELLYNLVAFI